MPFRVRGDVRDSAIETTQEDLARDISHFLVSHSLLPPSGAKAISPIGGDYLHHGARVELRSPISLLFLSGGVRDDFAADLQKASIALSFFGKKASGGRFNGDMGINFDGTTFRRGE